MIGPCNCQARHCRHYQGTKAELIEQNERHVCAAFPDGIPEEIALGENLHLQPVEGDHGIRFEEPTQDENFDELLLETEVFLDQMERAHYPPGIRDS